VRINAKEERLPGTHIDEWWTRRDAARYARVSEATIGREVRSGRLRHARVGGRRALRFRREWIDDWLAATAPAVVRVPHDREPRDGDALTA
jgi:excisionase family DNA binding protein